VAAAELGAVAAHALWIKMDARCEEAKVWHLVASGCAPLIARTCTKVAPW